MIENRGMLVYLTQESINYVKFAPGRDNNLLTSFFDVKRLSCETYQATRRHSDTILNFTILFLEGNLHRNSERLDVKHIKHSQTDTSRSGRTAMSTDESLDKNKYTGNCYTGD